MTDHVSIIVPPLADADPPDAVDDAVLAPAFWPDLKVSAFREQTRIDSVITDVRVRTALRAAMATVLLDVEAWGVAQTVAGHLTLADVPAILIDNESRLVLAWQRAVFCFAKADLLETYRDYDATGKAGRDEDWLDDSIVQLRRDAKDAVRDILGRPRTYCELI